jgi:sucrose-6-phosphate hydrolase SacC (GH32 family)
MKIKRLGLVFQPKFDNSWQDNSCLQPTPLMLEDRIRVFVGMRNKSGVSRVGYVDIDKNNPMQVLGYSQSPILDIGENGCFDDNGVVPCSILQDKEKILLYYAGYLIPSNFKFHVFSGLAISEDGGTSFQRYKKVPLMERTNNETCFRVVHSIIKKDESYTFFYGGGSSTKGLSPIYDIRTTVTNNLYSVTEEYKTAINLAPGRTRVGRPFVIKIRDLYYMFYGYSDAKTQYKLEYATSTNCENWQSNPIEIYGGDSDLDNEMSAYPSIFFTNDKYYILYNGNDYGKYGLLLGELEF